MTDCVVADLEYKNKHGLLVSAVLHINTFYAFLYFTALDSFFQVVGDFFGLALQATSKIIKRVAVALVPHWQTNNKFSQSSRFPTPSHLSTVNYFLFI